MKYKLVLQKMDTVLEDPVAYSLKIGEEKIPVNPWIGKRIRIDFTGYECLACGSPLPVFAQGVCKQCFFTIPETGQWIIHPELCTAHLDIEDRDLEYEKSVQLTPHIVYLAKTSNVKVGVTRKTQVPFRWIDQGADEAIAVLETPNRYLAGKAEVFLKQHFTDKTSWQKMLKGISTSKELTAEKKRLRTFLPGEFANYWIAGNKITRISYPLPEYPVKIKSVNIAKQGHFEGILTGIKGQYLIFESGQVFNVRNQAGSVVEWEVL